METATQGSLLARQVTLLFLKSYLARALLSVATRRGSYIDPRLLRGWPHLTLWLLSVAMLRGAGSSGVLASRLHLTLCHTYKSVLFHLLIKNATLKQVASVPKNVILEYDTSSLCSRNKIISGIQNLSQIKVHIGTSRQADGSSTVS